jgi:hypothetical protein
MVQSSLIEMWRVGRHCSYAEGSILENSDRTVPQMNAESVRSAPETSGPSTGSNLGSTQALAFESSAQDIEHVMLDSLRQPSVDLAVRSHAAQYLGTLEQVQVLSTDYFDHIWHRMPILSRKRFEQSLSTLAVNPRADFTALCLCIKLLQQPPSSQAHMQSMQSPLYISLKSTMSLFEATGYLTLEVVQCRIILTFYEVGHAIHSASYISIAACARAVRALGIGPKRSDIIADPLEVEERKRAWWATFNLDR